VGFGVALAVSALLDFAIFVGGVFVLVAWAKVFSVKPHSKIPAALWHSRPQCVYIQRCLSSVGDSLRLEG